MALDRVAAWLRERDDRRAEVDAYADPVAEPRRSTRLTDDRSRAVETYLRRQGIDSERVAVFGRGATMAVGTGARASENRVAVVNTCEPAPTPPVGVAVLGARVEPEQAPLAPGPPSRPPPSPAPRPKDADQGVRAGGQDARPASGVGIAFSGGGGVTGFVESRARGVANAGFTWDFRVTLGTRRPLGIDLAYVGSVQSLTVTGLATGALLMGNGAEADFRLQVPSGMLRPYAFGGLGWTHYSVQRADLGATGLRRSDNEGLLPFGGGLAIGRVDGLLLDLRGTYRLAFSDQLLAGLDNGDGSNSHMHSWAVTARLGSEF